MSFLFLIEDSGNRLSRRPPYSFRLRDAGGLGDDGPSGHQKGSDSGYVLTAGWAELSDRLTVHDIRTRSQDNVIFTQNNYQDKVSEVGQSMGRVAWRGDGKEASGGHL